MRSFRLSLDGRGWVTLALTLPWAIGFLVVAWAWSTPFLVVISFVGLVFALPIVFDGVPTHLHVETDRLALRRFLRPTLRAPLREVSVQLLADELVLVMPSGTVGIEARYFEAGELRACAELLRPRCARFVEKRARPGSFSS